jgi:hypothetical protein
MLIGQSGPRREPVRSSRNTKSPSPGDHQADVEKEDLARALDTVKRTQPPLAGIVHAAGILDDGILLQQTSTRFAAVLAPKVAGAWNLHVLTQDAPLDFMVFFSSMASMLGSAGQGSYAAANGFLDGLAHHRRMRGLPALSVNWGPWTSAGMAASQEGRWQQRRAAKGVDTISPEQGTQILGTLLGHASAQVGVLPIEWSRFLEQFDGGELPPILSAISHQVEPRPTRPKTRPEHVDLRQQLAEAPPAKRYEFLSSMSEKERAKCLGSSTRIHWTRTGRSKNSVSIR